MTPEGAADILRQTFFITAEIAAPLLMAILAIGIGVAVLQTITQISETTLVFIPKILFFIFVFSLTLPWMMKILIRFSHEVLIAKWNLVMLYLT